MTDATFLRWPVVTPFVHVRTAVADDIDEFGHVNNVRYIDWAMDAAWRHSNALGLGFADYQRIGVGCVVWRQSFEYLSPVIEGEEIAVATWIDETDGRLRLTRAFDMRCVKEGRTVMRGRTEFVTIDMKSGKPARMPKEFVAAYAPPAKVEKGE
jgi:acyl-CoA thioester hydrolase